jgi:hypothetical protein
VLAQSLEYEGAPLRLEKKVAYLERKREERKKKGKKVRGGGRVQGEQVPQKYSGRLRSR